MILAWLIIIPLVAGACAWIAAGWRAQWSRWISSAALGLEMILLLQRWASHFGAISQAQSGQWIAEFRYDWIPQLGASIHLAMDGLSFLMVVLTAFLGIAAVICSWTEIQERVGFFHFNLMASLAGIIGVFLAVDLILFYFFWEIMLVPIYFLIAIWGHENRIYAAIKFFLFTQASALFMLAAIIALYYIHGRVTGTYTFDYFALLGTPIDPRSAMWIMLGFCLAFGVKLPMVPLHTWLPDAHTEAPTAGSVILAGLLLKTGAYGFIRFVLPLFPGAASQVSSLFMGLGIVGIIYGALLAFAQTDLKRLVAYSSISHLGFVLLGVFSWNQPALQGAVMLMICHGISTGALFILVGMLQERIATRDMDRMGGLWAAAPLMGGTVMVFALAALGLPGTGNFVGEFLVLLGTYQANAWMALPAVAGLVLAAIYSLWILARVFFGPNVEGWRIRDLSVRETALMAIMMAAIVWLGFQPQPVINIAGQTVDAMQWGGGTSRTMAERMHNAEAQPWPSLKRIIPTAEGSRKKP